MSASVDNAAAAALPEEMGKVSLQHKVLATAPQDSGAGDSSSKGAAYLPENRVDMAIKQALEDAKERATVLNIEEQVERFIEDTKQPQLEFPGSFTNYQRMLAHRIAQHYGLQTSTVDYEEGPGRVIARRTPWCRLPKVKLRDLPVSASRPAAGVPKILVRPANTLRLGAPAGANNAGTPQQLSPTPPASERDRMDDYNAARDRLIDKSLEGASRNFGGPGGGRSGRGGGNPAGNPAGGSNNSGAGGYVAAGGVGNSGGRGGQQQQQQQYGAAGQPGPRSPQAAPRGGRKGVFRDRDKEMQDPDYRRGGGKMNPTKSPHLSPKNSQGDLHSTPPLSPQQHRDAKPHLNATSSSQQLHKGGPGGGQQQQGRPQLVALKGGHHQQQQDSVEPRDTQRQREPAGSEDAPPPRLQPSGGSRGERERGSRPSTSTSHNPPSKTPSPLPPNSPAHSNASSTTWHASQRGSGGGNVRAPPPPPHTPPKVYPPTYPQAAYHMTGTHPYPAFTMGPYPMAPQMGMPYHPAMGPSPPMGPGMPGHPPFMAAQYPGYPFPPQYAMMAPGAEGMAIASPYQYYPPHYGQMAFSPQFAAQPNPMGSPMMGGPGGMPPSMMGPPPSSKPSSRSNHSSSGGGGGGDRGGNNGGGGGGGAGASPRD